MGALKYSIDGADNGEFECKSGDSRKSERDNSESSWREAEEVKG